MLKQFELLEFQVIINKHVVINIKEQSFLPVIQQRICQCTLQTIFTCTTLACNISSNLQMCVAMKWLLHSHLQV
jgi:hypothetical protein